MGKRNRRIFFSVLLAISISCMSINNVRFVAANGRIEKGITSPTVQNFQKKAALTTKSNVLFGNYWQEDTNGDGKADESDEKTPIKWRVLWSSNSQALLMAEQCLDARAFHNTDEKVTWENCDLRNWLNQEFLQNAFNVTEQNAIVEKSIVTEGEAFFTENEEDQQTTDKVFLPSHSDMTNTTYGFSCDYQQEDSARLTDNTTYCAAKTDRYPVGESDSYWLRNSGQTNNQARAVYENGIIGYQNPVTFLGHGVRPMLYLDLTVQDVWKYADGQSGSDNIGGTGSAGDTGNQGDPGQTETPSVSEIKSNNLHKNEYPYFASQTVTSYFDDYYERVEYTGNEVIVETYDGLSFQKQSEKSLPMQLPIFGGAFIGNQYNFVVFGQENLEENDSTEVIRICKYCKRWNFLGSASIYGANTIRPFRSGSLRMCESGDMLYIRTSHQMYAASDGLNHQSNMTIAMRQSDTTVTDYYAGVMNTGHAGYVSHSFNQFIQVDGNDIIAADHGDAYPRSFVLVRYPKCAGGSAVEVKTEFLELNKFSGNIGDNYTGAELGGLESSSTHYLLSACSVAQETDYDGRVRNVYLYSVDKSTFSAGGVQSRQITQYDTAGNVSASVPYLIKLGSDQFVVIWEEYKPYSSGAFNPDIKCNQTLKYVLVDGKGSLQGEIKSVSGCLSDCKPVAGYNTLLWYVTEDSGPIFYQLDLENGTIEKKNSSQGSLMAGDVYQDGKIDGKDVSLLLQYRLKKRELTEEQIAAGDVYADGKIDGKDVSKLLQYRLGKIGSLE